MGDGFWVFPGKKIKTKTITATTTTTCYFLLWPNTEKDLGSHLRGPQRLLQKCYRQMQSSLGWKPSSPSQGKDLASIREAGDGQGVCGEGIRDRWARFPAPTAHSSFQSLPLAPGAIHTSPHRASPSLLLSAASHTWYYLPSPAPTHGTRKRLPGCLPARNWFLLFRSALLC